MRDLETIIKMNSKPKPSPRSPDLGKIILGEKCKVTMPDGEYRATVISTTETTADIKLDGHIFVLKVSLALALDKFKQAYPDLPDFYAC